MASIPPASSAPPSNGGNAAGQPASSAGARVLPVPPAAPTNPLSSQATASAATGNASNSSAPQHISAQALLTLLQTLGKPLSGTVQAGLPGQPGHTAQNSGSLSGQLSVQLSVPQAGAGQGSSGAPTQIITSLPLPSALPSTMPSSLPGGAERLANGTPVSVQATLPGQGGGADTSPARPAQITVTVTGSAPASADSLRADAARQGSLAPLFADVARLMGQQTSTAQSTSGPVAQAIEQLMGFTLKNDGSMNASTLRTALESALQGQSQPAATGNSTGSPGGQGLQSALGALIRALGLPTGSQQPNIAPPGTGQASPQNAGQSNPLPPPGSHAPTKSAPAPLPTSPPDLSDPAVLSQLKSKAEAALSRLNLLQAGEQGLQPRAGDSQAAPTSLRWDIPLLIGQEAALLGVLVDQDDHSDRDATKRTKNWRFRFAFESQALGGVEGLIALHQSPPASDSAGSVDVAVWVGEPAVLNRLDRQRETLVERLRALGLSVESLTLASADSHMQTESTGPSTPEHHHVDLAS